MKTKKKKWIIISAVLAAMIILGVFVLNIIVNKVFSKVTGSMVESGIITEGISGLPDGQGGTVKFNAETVKELESQVAMNDKFAVLALLAKALPPEEYSRLIGFLNDGVSDEEIQEAYAVMKKHLTPDQKKQIKEYYFKYLYLVQEPSE